MKKKTKKKINIPQASSEKMNKTDKFESQTDEEKKREDTNYQCQE